LTGQMLGSPNFMPPEQASSQRSKVGRHSDVYGWARFSLFAEAARLPSRIVESVINQWLNTEAGITPSAQSSVPPDSKRFASSACKRSGKALRTDGNWRRLDRFLTANRFMRDP